MKKFLSMALALVMTMALAIPAFAAENDSTVDVEIQKLAYGQDYEVYKLADLVSESGDNYAYSINEKYIDILIGIIKGDDADLGAECEVLREDGDGSASALNAKLVGYLSAMDTSGSIVGKNDIDSGYFGTVDAKAFSEAFANAVANVDADETFAVDAAEKFDASKPEMQNVGTVDAGYYVFVQSLRTAVAGVPQAKSLYIMNTASAVTGKLTIYPKSDKGTPTVDKTLADGGKVDYVDGGETVGYVISVEMPNTFWEYKTYLFALHDTAENQTIDLDSVKVEVYIPASEHAPTEGYRDITAKLTVSGVIDDGDAACAEHNLHVGTADLKKVLQDIADLEDPALSDFVTIFGAAPVLRVTYSATLDGDKANIGNTGNKNIVYGEFSNDPYYNGKGDEDPFNPPPEFPKDKTPGSMTILITYRTVVNKVDEKEEALKGAEFTLEKYNEGTWTAVQTFASPVTSDTTTFTFNAVGPGVYRLTESKVPSGYNDIDPVYFEISVDTEAQADENGVRPVVFNAVKATEGAEGWTFAKYGEQETESVKFDFTSTNGVGETSVQNLPGVLLPSTGGAGTTALYIGGVVALIAAAGAIVVISRKKKSAE